MSAVLKLPPANTVSWFENIVAFPSGTGAQTLFSTMEAAASKQWQIIEDQLFSYSSVADNWDGEGSIAPKPEIVSSAIDLVRNLKVRPELYSYAPSNAAISTDGSIVIVWRTNGLYADAEISTVGLVDWMVIPAGSQAEHSTNKIGIR